MMTTQNTTKATKAPSHSCPRYVAARIRKLLAAKGWPMHKVTGRYSVWGSTQVASEGFEASKVGCSKNVSVGYYPSMSGGRGGVLPKEVMLARKAEAIEYLRSLGYRIDERGWIACDHHDECDF